MSWNLTLFSLLSIFSLSSLNHVGSSSYKKKKYIYFAVLDTGEYIHYFYYQQKYLALQKKKKKKKSSIY